MSKRSTKSWSKYPDSLDSDETTNALVDGNPRYGDSIEKSRSRGMLFFFNILSLLVLASLVVIGWLIWDGHNSCNALYDASEVDPSNNTITTSGEVKNVLGWCATGTKNGDFFKYAGRNAGTYENLTGMVVYSFVIGFIFTVYTGIIMGHLKYENNTWFHWGVEKANGYWWGFFLVFITLLAGSLTLAIGYGSVQGQCDQARLADADGLVNTGTAGTQFAPCLVANGVENQAVVDTEFRDTSETYYIIAAISFSVAFVAQVVINCVAVYNYN